MARWTVTYPDSHGTVTLSDLSDSASQYLADRFPQAQVTRTLPLYVDEIAIARM